MNSYFIPEVIIPPIEDAIDPSVFLLIITPRRITLIPWWDISFGTSSDSAPLISSPFLKYSLYSGGAVSSRVASGEPPTAELAILAPFENMLLMIPPVCACWSESCC